MSVPPRGRRHDRLLSGYLLIQPPAPGEGGICGVLPVLVCEGMLSELRALLDVDVEVFRLGAMCQC